MGHPLQKVLRRLAVVSAAGAGAAKGARLLRDRAVAANTLRYDHVLDFTKPFLGTPAEAEAEEASHEGAGGSSQSGSVTPSSASR